jgi:phosphate:Na+ symporter
MIGIIGANTNSKRTALIHLLFNVSGCLIFTPILWIFSDSIVNILSKLSSQDSQRIAFFHLFFNIATAIITTPLIKFLVKFVSFAIKNKDKPEEFLEWFIKDKEDKDESLLDPRPTSNSININSINEENAIIDMNQSESHDDTIIKDDKLIKDDNDKIDENNKDQNLIIKDEIVDIKKDKEEKKNREKEENKILINNIDE